MKISNRPEKTCYADDCCTLIPRSMLMCGPHWRSVSRPTQLEVNRTYRAWLRGGSVRPYLTASNQAQLEVSEKGAA